MRLILALTLAAKALLKELTMKAKPQNSVTQEAYQIGDLALIPLDQLVRSPLNVRKTRGTGIEELAALILAQNVLENLLVYKEIKKGRSTGKYAVAAGDRRHQALMLLASRKQILPEHGVPCLLVSEDRAIEVSLAENCHEPMHPADEFEAFQAMIENGRSVEETAAIFGVLPIVVQRRLKLAKVSPKMLALYREGEIGLDQLMALAITDEHAAQERAWDSLPSYSRNAQALRRVLTDTEIDASTDPLAIYVGLDAYEKAGGGVRRDLFNDEGGGYLEDALLLESLALAKLQSEAVAIKDEGWAWLDVRTRCDSSEFFSFGRARRVRREPTAAEKKKLEALNKAQDKINEDMENFEGDDDEYNAFEARNDALGEQLEELEDQLLHYAPETLASCGAVVTLDYHGRVDVRRGLIRPEDKSKVRGPDNGERNEEKPRPVHSERLTRQLTAQRTVALQAVLSTRADVALVVLTHKLVSQVFGGAFFGSVAQISVQEPDLLREASDMEKSLAWLSLLAQREAWVVRLPLDDEQGLFQWLLEQPQDDVLALLAFCTACTVNTVQSDDRPKPAMSSMAQALGLDMADWWTPTRDSYLAHVPKARLVEIVSEAVSTEAAKPIAAMKKEEAIKAASECLEGKRWLPNVLRLLDTPA